MAIFISNIRQLQTFTKSASHLESYDDSYMRRRNVKLTYYNLQFMFPFYNLSYLILCMKAPNISNMYSKINMFSVKLVHEVFLSIYIS